MTVPKLRVGGVPEHFNLPWRLAIANDAFASIATEVEYIDCPGGTGQMMSALREGELDAALVLTEGAVADILKNDSSRLVRVYVDSPLVWGIHVAAHSDIESVDEIRGRRIAISRYGSGSHLISIVDAAERGWPTADMSFVVVNDLDGARKALASDEAEIFLWERHMTQVLVDKGEFRRIGERAVPWPAFVVAVRSDYLDANTATVHAVLDAVAEEAKQLKQRPDAADIVARHYEISVDDAARWLATVEWNTDSRRPDDALRRVLDALGTQGMVSSKSARFETLWQSE